MIRLFAFLLLAFPAMTLAEDVETYPAMTMSRMGEIVTALDPNMISRPGSFEFVINDIPMVIITDVAANRMRAMIPLRLVDGMTPDEMKRALQANFDTALDSRYAIADGRLWAVYIHPFKELDKDQLISGIAQTVNIAVTYGSLYSGGAVQFGRGDSVDLQRKLLEELLERGQDI